MVKLDTIQTPSHTMKPERIDHRPGQVEDGTKELCVTFRSNVDMNWAEEIMDASIPCRNVVTEFDCDNKYMLENASKSESIFDSALLIARLNGSKDMESVVSKSHPLIAASYISETLDLQSSLFARKWNHEVSFAILQAIRMVLDYIRANYTENIYNHVHQCIMSSDSNYGILDYYWRPLDSRSTNTGNRYSRYGIDVNITEISAPDGEFELLRRILRSSVMKSVVEAYDKLMRAIMNAVYMYRGSGIANANNMYADVESVASSVFQTLTQEFIDGENLNRMVLDFLANHSASFPNCNLDSVAREIYRGKHDEFSF